MIIRHLAACLVVCVLALLVPGAPASAQERYAAFVADMETGEVLHARRPDASRYPASLTKMMTLYMLFEALERGELTLATPLTMSAEAASRPPSKLGAPAGNTINTETAIRALVIRSANDVAVMVAEHLAGSEAAFAEAMTDRAVALGLTATVFRNASGLPMQPSAPPRGTWPGWRTHCTAISRNTSPISTNAASAIRGAPTPTTIHWWGGCAAWTG